MPKQTLLYDAHSELGARIIDFNGWAMPVQYKTGILAEHTAVREKAGIFDTCHMGEFMLESPDVRKTLNTILCGDFTNLKDGRMRYTFITAEDGTVVDDAVVFIISDTEAMICVNAGDIEGDYEFLLKYLPEGNVLDNQSEKTGKIDIQGPNAHIIVEKITGVDFRTLPFYSFIVTEWQGATLILSRSGYTGSPGVEFFIDADVVGQLWYSTLQAGEEHGLIPCGLGARDTLRLEAGLPLYGHELSRGTNPLQAGFKRFVSLDKDEDFPGKAALKNFAENESAKAQVLCGLTIEGRRTPRQGFEVTSPEGKTIGVVTSGGPAPTVGGNIALAYINPEFAEIGEQVAIDIRSKPEMARVTKLPFYKCENLRKNGQNLA